jgi:hypothetical protein
MNMDISNNILYIGGQFSTSTDASGTINAGFITSWNGDRKRFVYMGLSTTSNGLYQGGGLVNSVLYNSVTNRVYIAGSFNVVYDGSGNTTGGAVVNRTAIWDISMQRYLTVGGTVNPNANPYTNTSKLGMDISNGVIYGYYNVATDASGVNLFSGCTSYDIKMNRFARIGGPDPKTVPYNSNTCPNGGMYPSISVMDPTNTLVYMLGNHTGVRDSLNYVNTNQVCANGGIYNIITRTWSSFGTPAVNGTGYRASYGTTLSFDLKRNRFYSFFYVFQLLVPGITVSTNGGGYFDLNKNTYNAMGVQGPGQNGFYGPQIYSIEVTKNGVIFTGAMVGIYNSDWCPTANGLLGYDIKNDRLFQLGGPAEVNNYNNGVDKTIKKSTTALASSITITPYYVRDFLPLLLPNRASVSSLTLDPSNSLLYVGGSYNYSFDSSNIYQTTKNISCFNIKTNSFFPIGYGVDASVNTITLGDTNIYGKPTKYVGGSFQNVYDLSNTTFVNKYLGFAN